MFKVSEKSVEPASALPPGSHRCPMLGVECLRFLDMPYRVVAPGAGGWYEEILNTDTGIYGGGNIGISGGMHAD